MLICEDLRVIDMCLQSFCAALHQELTEYYRLIAVLAAQVFAVVLFYVSAFCMFVKC